MKIRIQVPTTLRRFTAQQSLVEVEAVTAGQALRAVAIAYPTLRPHLFASDGTLRRFINVFVNDCDIRTLQHEDTAVRENDTLTILPAIAGG